PLAALRGTVARPAPPRHPPRPTSRPSAARVAKTALVMRLGSLVHFLVAEVLDVIRRHPRVGGRDLLHALTHERLLSALTVGAGTRVRRRCRRRVGTLLLGRRACRRLRSA